LRASRHELFARTLREAMRYCRRSADRSRDGAGAPVLHSARRDCTRRRVRELRPRPDARRARSGERAQSLHGDRRRPRHATDGLRRC
jgi:hypothetical protein